MYIIQNKSSNVKNGYFAQIEQVAEGFCSFLFFFENNQMIVERDEFQDTLAHAKITFEKYYGFSPDGWFNVDISFSLIS